jgi:hypothetical protein
MEAWLIARPNGLKLPLIYNGGGYENPPDMIKIPEGVVDIYLPDFKYANERVVNTALDMGFETIFTQDVDEMASTPCSVTFGLLPFLCLQPCLMLLDQRLNIGFLLGKTKRMGVIFFTDFHHFNFFI